MNMHKNTRLTPSLGLDILNGIMRQAETFAKFPPPDSRNPNTSFRLFLFQISTDSPQIPS